MRLSIAVISALCSVVDPAAPHPTRLLEVMYDLKGTKRLVLGSVACHSSRIHTELRFASCVLCLCLRQESVSTDYLWQSNLHHIGRHVKF